MAADLSPKDRETLEALLQSLHRDINCLADDNRGTRKRALEKIRKEVFSKKPHFSATVLQVTFEEILKPALKLFADPTEKCRELSVQLVSEFSKQVTDLSQFLPYLIPTVVQRLGQPELVEPCEELRLYTVELLSSVTETCGGKIGVYIDDMIKILQRTLVDPFHDVRKESCQCTNILAAACPEQFYFQANSLVTPLLRSLSHQHSKVRVSCVQTLGIVISYGDGKNVDDVVSHLAQRTFDSAPTVRAAVINVVGDWLLNLRDRYSYFHKLLPLLMTGLSDELPDIQKQSRQLMSKVGNQYAVENEDDLKDKIDFEEKPGYRLVMDVDRPSLGCRVLVQRNLSKILPAALRDMTDWTVDTRIKASSLVYFLLFYAEDYTTQHMEILLQGLYKASQDDNDEVVKQVVLISEMAGSFVDPAVFCKLALPHLKSSASSSSSGCSSCLMILTGLLRGCNPQLVKPNLKAICDTIASSDVCCTQQMSCQQNLLATVSAIIDKAGDESRTHSFTLFYVLIHVMALQLQGSLQKEVNAVLLKLTTSQGLDSVSQLYENHIQEFLDKLKENHSSWSQYSPECRLFDVLLTESGQIISRHLTVSMAIFTECLDSTKKSAELRLKMFSLLSRLLMSASQSVESQNAFSSYSVHIVQKLIIPNCVWQAGRTAAAVGSAAISCLWALLQSNLLSNRNAGQVMKDLLTQLASSLDDHNQTTRLVSCKALQKLLISCKSSFNADMLHQIYPELLKRMDDSSDEIRIVVTNTFLAYFRAFPSDYNSDLYKLHLEAMFKGLLVQLDDPTASIQEAVLNVLKEAALVQPTLMKEQVESVRHKHRVARYCEELLKECESLINK
ncbi:dynein axonemal assembly factor 5-like [Montipora capricornis]|uniref:dynein axonemal assembly factor 5-like n=1 Tax=Montipora capricornis TaxID=246305 RepID=UPI0035F1E360